MKIKMIVCMDFNKGIGSMGSIPWHSSNDPKIQEYAKEDLAYFKRKTKNCRVVMGRKTLESMEGIPLSNRMNMIVSNRKKPDWVSDSVLWHSAEGVRKFIDLAKQEKIVSGDGFWIIGGSQIYKEFDDLIDQYYITVMPGKYTCDTFLDLDLSKLFVKYCEYDPKNRGPIYFVADKTGVGPVLEDELAHMKKMVDANEI